MLPSMYTATVDHPHRRPEIPDDLVHTTVTGFVEERIRTLKQIVLSRATLTKIIEELDVYPEMSKSYSVSELTDKMRKDILIDLIQTEVTDTRTGRSSAATVAFKRVLRAP